MLYNRLIRQKSGRPEKETPTDYCIFAAPNFKPLGIIKTCLKT